MGCGVVMICDCWSVGYGLVIGIGKIRCADWFRCMFRFMKLVWLMDCCLTQASCSVRVKLL
jgi:hypothetical protein